MQQIEIFGFAIAVVHLTIVIIFGYFPPHGPRAGQDKPKWWQYIWNIHAFYVVSLVAISIIFAHLLWGVNSELATMKAKSEQKEKLTSQANAALKSMPPYYIQDEDCRGIILTSFAFLEKWKSEFPEAFDKARAPADRASKPLAKGIDKVDQQQECKADAYMMRDLLKGLAAQ